MRKLSFILVFTFMGCASVASNFRDVLPLLAERTLLVSKTKPGSLEYPYKVCTKRGLFGGCKEWAQGSDYYDLSDAAMAAKLRDMNFECRVREDVQ